MPPASDVHIDSDHAAFLESGVSINIGTCDAGLKPNIARALGCRLSPDRLRLTLFVSRAQAALALDDIASDGRVAAVFSQPSTHKTMQLKGRDARIAPLADGDLQRVAAYREAFIGELAALGYDPTMIRVFLSCPDDEITALAFSPSSAFLQTPGPRAGEPLGTAP